MANRLLNATSPYLLQHADNPVDWWEWSPEAFAEAAARDVPILLSVGYASCHWCHVMAHESFEDPATTAIMNSRFVNVKVDREERPDIDRIYMDAVQAMTGQGGWPMTVFLTPTGAPFFAGTYFPKTDRHGHPAFTRVLDSIHDAWTNRRAEVEAQAGSLVETISVPTPTGDSVPGLAALRNAYKSIRAAYDPMRGGFGRAPKFPQPSTLEFLLRSIGKEWAPEAQSMLIQTLDAMANGGIHDQVGGGFSRYAVDDRWLVPHFEKMLYDNALLARLYARASQVTGLHRFADIARSTLDYMLGDLGLPGGGFASGEDADSEGEEGRFYIFSWSEFSSVTDSEAVAEVLGVTPD
ncbi:MAG: thioredoxin domain-containing protein, partial [Acidimicrobiia bacterium]